MLWEIRVGDGFPVPCFHAPFSVDFNGGIGFYKQDGKPVLYEIPLRRIQGGIMKRSKGIKIFASVIIAAATLWFIGYNLGIVGVSANRIELDARMNQQIAYYEFSESLNDELCAMIFYDGARLDHTFSIYVNHPGFSFGYFFNRGGSSSQIESGVHAFDYDEKGTALISMNADKVARIVLDDDVDTTQIDLDPANPFAVVIPPNCGSVSLYDSDGAAVPISMVDA